MARPRKITNEQIVEAARRAFLQHGHAVTTAMIAQEAGVSEGTIFKRFPNKEALFRAAMGLPELEIIEELQAMAGRGTIRDNLLCLASQILVFMRAMVPRLTMLTSHGGFDPLEYLREHPDPAPLRGLRLVAQYARREAELGRLRPDMDPEVFARVFLGALHNFASLEQVGIQAVAGLDAEVYTRGLVDVLLRGVLPGRPDGESTPGDNDDPAPRAAATQPLPPAHDDPEEVR